MDRINKQRTDLLSALKICPDGPRYGQLHAALQALNWVASPDTFDQPAYYLNGIREGFPDCSADTRLAPSQGRAGLIADVA